MDPQAEKVPRKPKESQATKLVEAVAAANELFRSPDRDEYVSVFVGGHRETYLVKSSQFRHYLRRVCLATAGKVPSRAVISDVQEQCSAIAAEGPTYDVFFRVGEAHGSLWLDLADDDWITIKIDTEGWSPVHNPPVRFRRAPGTLALPMPKMGGSLGELRQFVNVDDDDYCLILSWLCACFRSSGPYAILIASGEQGTGKSTLIRLLRELCDPHKLPIRAAPHEKGDLLIAARGSHMVCFDNLSKVDHWLSDAFCRLSTGGGMGKRELYTDAEEVILNYSRPLALNAIEDLASRGDLQDRSIVIYLPVIPESRRVEESVLWSAFHDAQSGILGSLLDAIAGGLRNMEQGVHIDAKPRMADFSCWSVACEGPLGFAPGTFLSSYSENRAESTAVILETPFAQAIIAFAREHKVWKGTATQMIAEFRLIAFLNEKSWPQTPRAFSGALRRLAPHLRSVGVNFLFGKREPGTGNKLIYLSYAEHISDYESKEATA